MIEKLKNIPLDMNGEPSAVWLKINELVDAVNAIQKEREAERFEIQEWIGILEAVRESVNIHEKQIDELQMKLEPEKCATGTTADKLLDPTPSMLEEVLEKQKKEEERKILEALTPDLPDGDDAIQEVIHADPYAEQRKLICKLCWFWNNDKADKVIGILTGVLDEADRPFERNIDQTLYKHCDPVKPDDDIIYKGE